MLLEQHSSFVNEIEHQDANRYKYDQWKIKSNIDTEFENLTR